VFAAARSIMSSGSSSNCSGDLEPSDAKNEAANPFNRSLSDITDEDLELLVAQRVTCGAFSSWFVAIVVVYFDALEGQKVTMQCASSTLLKVICQHVTRWRNCTRKPL
jgi:hypothetical protein